MGSNYAPTIHVQKEASKQGLQQVLWLYGPDHQLTEVGTMNIFVLYVNEQGGLYLNTCHIFSFDKSSILTRNLKFANRTRSSHTTIEWTDFAWNHTRLSVTLSQTMGRLPSIRRFNNNGRYLQTG